MDREVDLAQVAAPVRRRVPVPLLLQRDADDIAVEVSKPPWVGGHEQDGGEEFDGFAAHPYALEGRRASVAEPGSRIARAAATDARGVRRRARSPCRDAAQWDA